MSQPSSLTPPRACPVADNNLALIKIGAVAEMTGLSPSSLRMYEQFGLVLPYKEPNGQRLYSMDDIHAIRQFHQAVNEQKTSLSSLAWLLRSAPVKDFRCKECDQVCNVEPQLGRQACWEVYAKKPEWRRACRACPAYLSRCKVLEFHRHFAICRANSAATVKKDVPQKCCC